MRGDGDQQSGRRRRRRGHGEAGQGAGTPELDGRSFGTNVMEGVLVAVSGRKPSELTPDDYLKLLAQLNWQPRVETLNP